MKIESNIPIPRKGKLRTWDAPEMNIGDSVLLPIGTPIQGVPRIKGQKVSGKKYLMLAVDHINMRIWRIK